MNSLSLALLSGSSQLREGMEAMLVIAALSAFLRRAGAPAELRATYPGAGSGAHDDQPEAVAMLLASVLML